MGIRTRRSKPPCAATVRGGDPRHARAKGRARSDVQIAKALYSVPRHFVGRTLRARADQDTVRMYDGLKLVKTHARQPPGGRSTDPTDFPAERSVYALRDVDALRRQAASYGDAVGRFADAVLEDPLLWTRMRRVYAVSVSTIVRHTLPGIGGQAFSPDWGPPVFGR